MAFDTNDPRWRNNEGSMGSNWTDLLNLLHHEAVHFIMVLQTNKQTTVKHSLIDIIRYWHIFCKLNLSWIQVTWLFCSAWIQAPVLNKLTACLHQEQLMDMMSLLWKANFCWKPCREEQSHRFIPAAAQSRPSPHAGMNLLQGTHPPSHIVCICLLDVSDAPSDDAPQWAEQTQKIAFWIEWWMLVFFISEPQKELSK